MNYAPHVLEVIVPTSRAFRWLSVTLPFLAGESSTRWPAECWLRRGLNIELNHPPNFERLVIDVIEANLCNQILILQHFSRSTRLAFLCTAPISKIQSKIAANFAKLNIENSIGTSQFSQENCYFSPKSRWNFVGISRMCSKISKLTEDCRKFAKFWEILVKLPQLIEKFNRKVH